MTKKQYYTIRELEWEKRGRDQWIAQIPYGYYGVSEGLLHSCRWWLVIGDCPYPMKEADSLEDTKAKAQEHWNNLLEQVLEKQEAKIL